MVRLAVLVALTVCSSSVFADVTGKVVSVTDGDTVRVLDASNVQHKVRLIGIDAPERGQPYGTKSRDYLASLVAGKDATVESTKKDRYGRTLGKICLQPSDCPCCGKTLDANHAQVLAGMAWLMQRSNHQRIEGGMSLLRMMPRPECGASGLIRTRLILMSGARVSDRRFF